MDLEKRIRSSTVEIESDSEPTWCCWCTGAFTIASLITTSIYFLGMWLQAQDTNGFNTITASVSLATIDYVSTASGSASLSAAFDVRIELKNHGLRSGINYGDTVVFLRHKGANESTFPIRGARVKETRAIGLLLPLVCNANTSSSVLYSDVVSGGVLKLQVYVRFTGKGHNAKVFVIWLVAEATCDVWIDLSSRALSYGECHENAPETKVLL